MMVRASLFVLLLAVPLHGAVIGHSQAAESISADRIAKLPERERAAWTAYVERSARQRAKDRAGLESERAPGAPEPPLAKEDFGARSMPLNKDRGWYGGAEARHIADVIVSFQTPAGGWSKNLDMGGAARLRGQGYATDSLSKHLGEEDFDAPADPKWNYVGTMDNDATNTELRFLARVAAALPGRDGEAYRASFLRGVQYVLAAQFPNGGWPQVWPLEGGYHDAITFNDDAVTESAELMSGVAASSGDYGFVPAEVRRHAGEAARRAVVCILATQVVVKGKRTVWAQQHDALTLEPVAGRNFEPAALSSGESADVLMYLMELPRPSAGVVAAVMAGVAWMKGAEIYGEAWAGARGTAGGRQLVSKAGAGPIWARYYDIATGRPVFGDRDKTIHDDVNELSLERRNGYAWFGTGPQKVLERYTAWSREHPAAR